MNTEEIIQEEETIIETSSQEQQIDNQEALQDDTESPKKRGRGRPKGSTKEKISDAAQNDDKSENVDDYLKSFEKTEPQTQAGADSPAPAPSLPEATVIINGYMVLMIADFVIPALISIALPMFSGYEVESKSLKLDKDERRELKPFADEAAKSLVLSMSPLQLFLICMGAMYTEKTISSMKKKNK